MYILDPTNWIGSPSPSRCANQNTRPSSFPALGIYARFCGILLDGRGRREAKGRLVWKGGAKGVWGWVYVCVPMLIILCSRGFGKLTKKRRKEEDEREKSGAVESASI